MDGDGARGTNGASNCYGEAEFFKRHIKARWATRCKAALTTSCLPEKGGEGSDFDGSKEICTEISCEQCYGSTELTGKSVTATALSDVSKDGLLP